MIPPKKGLSLALVLVIAVSSLIFIQSTVGVSKPSVPEFTAEYVPATYSVTTTDPYTGIVTTTQHPNNTIQITIKNQQFTDSSHKLFYNIQVRPHFEGNWTELYPLWDLANAPYNSETESFPTSQYLHRRHATSPSNASSIRGPLYNHNIHSK